MLRYIFCIILFSSQLSYNSASTKDSNPTQVTTSSASSNSSTSNNSSANNDNPTTNQKNTSLDENLFCPEPLSNDSSSSESSKHSSLNFKTKPDDKLGKKLLLAQRRLTRHNPSARASRSLGHSNIIVTAAAVAQQSNKNTLSAEVAGLGHNSPISDSDTDFNDFDHLQACTASLDEACSLLRHSMQETNSASANSGSTSQIEKSNQTTENVQTAAEVSAALRVTTSHKDLMKYKFPEH